MKKDQNPSLSSETPQTLEPNPYMKPLTPTVSSYSSSVHTQNVRPWERSFLPSPSNLCNLFLIPYHPFHSPLCTSNQVLIFLHPIQGPLAEPSDLQGLSGQSSAVRGFSCWGLGWLRFVGEGQSPINHATMVTGTLLQLVVVVGLSN